MRYEISYDSYGTEVIRPNWWMTELKYLRDDSDLEIDAKGNLCLVVGKNRFAYMKIDKEGTIHIPNVPRMWLNKNIKNLISVCVRTYIGLQIYPIAMRGYPGMWVARESGGWLRPVKKFLLEDEKTKEITISIDGEITGMREIKKRTGNMTSKW
jgi:hypothetical protein